MAQGGVASEYPGSRLGHDRTVPIPGQCISLSSPNFQPASPQTPSKLSVRSPYWLRLPARKKTVFRAFGGKMYLGTTGNPNSYATGQLERRAFRSGVRRLACLHRRRRHYISTWANPFPLHRCSPPYSRHLTINQQSSLDPGASVVSADLHMPREYDWSFNVQRQFPWDTLLEVGYSANRGLGCWPPIRSVTIRPTCWFRNMPPPCSSRLLLRTPAKRSETTITGSMQQLGLLEYNYPYYGRVQVSGINEGRSIYNALIVKVEQRLAKGMQILVNYTMSKPMDDVGGPDGTGGKTAQSVLPSIASMVSAHSTRLIA